MKRNYLGQFTSLGMMGTQNPKWKGEKVGYFALHTWVQRKLGKAKKCSLCNSTKYPQWANKSKFYKRELTDWIELCSKCHRNYDKENLGRKRILTLTKKELLLLRKKFTNWKEVAFNLGISERTIYFYLSKYA